MLKRLLSSPEVMVHSFNPRQRPQEDVREFKDSLPGLQIEFQELDPNLHIKILSWEKNVYCEPGTTHYRLWDCNECSLMP